MAPRFEFTVVYEEATVKSAVRSFLVRMLFLENTWMSYVAYLGIIILLGLVLFGREFTIYGGNIASTMAGEFSFSIGLSLALLF